MMTSAPPDELVAKAQVVIALNDTLNTMPKDHDVSNIKAAIEKESDAFNKMYREWEEKEV